MLKAFSGFCYKSLLIFIFRFITNNWIRLKLHIYIVMSDNEALITQFMDVTGVTRERAEFYLESSNYQLQVIFLGY